MSAPEGSELYPWLSEPRGLGSTECTWCGRSVYLPAVPCSVEPIVDINDIETRPGRGDRCKWETNTRGRAA